MNKFAVYENYFEDIIYEPKWTVPGRAAHMSYTALIVDDSLITRAALERALKMTMIDFVEIVQASNGEEALLILENRWIDITFSDIHMPGMSGIELVQKMKNRPDLKKIPVVIISTEGSATRIRELNEIGINGYLRKPFSPEELRDMVCSILAIPKK